MCGIIGVAKRSKDAVLDVYDGLLMLQHRGQDAAGIVGFDGTHFREKRGNGLVRDVFHERHIKKLEGQMAIGHVRYPTAGTSDASEAQPFFVNSPYGIYLIHNGNLTNAAEKREIVQNKYHRHLQTQSDTEVLLNSFADKIHDVMKSQKYKDEENDKVIFEAVEKLMTKIQGAYSIISLINEVGLVAFRDPNGIRPLSLGKKSTTKGDEWCVASEDVAFKAIGFKKVRDVKPGEAIILTLDGRILTKQCAPGKLTPCIFEYIYLARPDSMIDEISVYKTRLRLGQALAKQVKAANLEIDSVIPVPDSSRPMAMELANELGLKYREGLVKNRYVGRTFIMPDQPTRMKCVKRKLNTVSLEFRNRNVLLVDDSIVRGTTMKQIVQMCRDAGAKNVYVASAAPPVRFPNVYGVDMPTRKELIANGLTTEQVAEALHIDKLFYQTLEDTIASAQFGNPEIKEFDCSCFSGEYVTGNITEGYLENLERSKRSEKRELPLLSI